MTAYQKYTYKFSSRKPVYKQDFWFEFKVSMSLKGKVHTVYKTETLASLTNLFKS